MLLDGDAEEEVEIDFLCSTLSACVPNLLSALVLYCVNSSIDISSLQETRFLAKLGILVMLLLNVNGFDLGLVPAACSGGEGDKDIGEDPEGEPVLTITTDELLL